MRRARLVAGADGAETREISWIAVSEGPVEDFVHDGEIILTSGMGYDAAGFARVVREVAESGAAGMCVGVGPGRFQEAAGHAAIAVADEIGLPLIELPWEVRFADVTRSVIDRVLADRYGSTDRDGIQDRFINVVLDGLGFRGIAELVDRTINRPIVVFDRELRPVAFSAAARTTLGPEATESCRAAAATLTAKQVDDLSESLSQPGHALRGLAPLGLGGGIGTAATASGEPVAYVYALLQDGDEFSECDRAVLGHASTALAMEAVRQQSATQAEAAAHGHFLWSLVAARTSFAEELAGKGPMLGYSTRSSYEVMVADWSDRSEYPSTGGADGHENPEWLERLLHRAAQLKNARIQTARRDEEVLVVAEASPDGRQILPDLAAALQKEIDGSSRVAVAFGLASSCAQLGRLSAAYQEARQALVVGRVVLGPRCVAHASDLAPFLMLRALSEDQTTRDIASETLSGLTNYDSRTSRNLVQTLEVYLEEGGNASAAARRLYMNRHSLLYRLRKIEELTGRSLGSPHDRFVLDLSLKLQRFEMLGAADALAGGSTAVDRG